MGVSPDLDHTNMWRKWRGSCFLLTWITLQVLCPAVSGLRHKTACNNFTLIVDPPCAAREMLLPTMFTLGVSSDVTCHSEITGTSLRQKVVEEIRRCCQQRENDTVTDYCLPAMKHQLKDHYYLDFVNTCTAATKCMLSTPLGKVHHTYGEDYVTFTFECVQTGCIVVFTDGDVSTKVDCKNPPASRNCSSAMFESKSNYVNMSVFMTVDPGRQEKEFLWLLAKADTGKNVTVVCGANIPADVSLNCPTSASTTPSTTSTLTPTTSTSASTTTSTTSTLTPTASTPASTTTSTTSTSASTTSTSASTTSTSASTTTTSTTSTTTTNVAANTATATTQTSNNASSKHTPVAVTCEPCNTLPISLGVSVAVLFVGFVSGWIMSRRFYPRQTRKNGADVYNTTSAMKEEHTYSTVQPTSAATYANTSYESSYNQ